MIGRLSKIVMCLAIGLFATLVAIDNVIDYGTNYAFVQHVLGMDTIHADDTMISRAVKNPALWRDAYALIIVGEALTGVLFLISAGALALRARASAADFRQAKRWSYAAGSLGFLVWFLGFMVVGGEWFQMWQSARWNGQEAAFRFTMVILAVLVFISQPDDVPPGR